MSSLPASCELGFSPCAWPSCPHERPFGLSRIPTTPARCHKSPVEPAWKSKKVSIVPGLHGRQGVVCSTMTVDRPIEQDFTWKGSDEFTELGDRQDKQPLALPQIKEPKRVVLVRHGQSTCNAEGRVQGSTDFAVLTAKGISQAETTREMLQNDVFDTMFFSPLKRAAKTGRIIWDKRKGKSIEMPSLREIDLYSFQGLLKHEGKERYGEQYTKWQKQAYLFEIDSQFPIRELWYRASLAWQDILNRDDVSSALVAAHNAVNQALVATAIGFPPTMFRRLLQSNGATTVLDFSPRPNQSPLVTVNRLNQTPGSPLGGEPLKPGTSRLVLVRGGSVGGRDGRLLGRSDEHLSVLGRAQAQKAAELLLDTKIDLVVSSPLLRARDTAVAISDYQAIDGSPKPELQTMEELTDRDWGSSQGRLVQEVRNEQRCSLQEPLPEFEKRTKRAIEEIGKKSHEGQGAKTIVVVAHSAVLSALICHMLGLQEVEENLSLFRTDAGSISVVDLPDKEDQTYGIMRCINYTAHLGRWAIPVTREDLDSDKLCGIDGCF